MSSQAMSRMEWHRACSFPETEAAGEEIKATHWRELTTELELLALIKDERYRDENKKERHPAQRP